MSNADTKKLVITVSLPVSDSREEYLLAQLKHTRILTVNLPAGAFGLPSPHTTTIEKIQSKRAK